MDIKRKFNLDVRKTVENSVAGNEDFHFYVDELTSENCMPTYAGKADEKYTFDEMDDEFFEFLQHKISGDGIYIRLIYATASEESGEAVFILEYGETREEFRTSNLDNVCVFEFADFGIKVMGDEIIFGATIEWDCHRTPYFAEFNSSKAMGKFISLENPLNRHVIKIMEGMIK